MDIRRLSGALGAEVRGIDLEHADPATIRQLVLDHLVVISPSVARRRLGIPDA